MSKFQSLFTCLHLLFCLPLLLLMLWALAQDSAFTTGWMGYAFGTRLESLAYIMMWRQSFTNIMPGSQPGGQVGYPYHDGNYRLCHDPHNAGTWKLSCDETQDAQLCLSTCHSTTEVSDVQWLTCWTQQFWWIHPHMTASPTSTVESIIVCWQTWDHCWICIHIVAWNLRWSL